MMTKEKYLKALDELVRYADIGRQRHGATGCDIDSYVSDREALLCELISEHFNPSAYKVVFKISCSLLRKSICRKSRGNRKMKLFLMNCMEWSEQTMEVKITFDDGKVGLVHEVMEIKKEDDDVHIRFQKGLMICYELYIKSIEIIEI